MNNFPVCTPTGAGESWVELTSQEVANLTVVWGCISAGGMSSLPRVFPALANTPFPSLAFLAEDFFPILMEIGQTTIGSRTCISTRRFK